MSEMCSTVCAYGRLRFFSFSNSSSSSVSVCFNTGFPLNGLKINLDSINFYAIAYSFWNMTTFWKCYEMLGATWFYHWNVDELLYFSIFEEKNSHRTLPEEDGYLANVAQINLTQTLKHTSSSQHSSAYEMEKAEWLYRPVEIHFESQWAAIVRIILRCFFLLITERCCSFESFT